MAESSSTARPLPRGTVTFLFTDIEGSTKLAHALGDRFPELLGRHHEVLREAFARHDGVEVVTTGDGFFVGFADAALAVRAAVDAQRALIRQDWPEGAQVRVRMGLHTGEPTIIDDDYVGVDVHRAARIAAAAHGGQIVISETTAALVGRSFDTRDLGEHRLKDLAEPERIRQVLAPGLAADFPGLRSLTPPSNVPTRPDPIVGRDREIEDLRRLLLEDGARLITIHGPGGAGKTRLAIEVAGRLKDEFIDGSFFVELTMAAAAGVEMAIADTLGKSGEDDRASTDLAEEIGDARVLLVLDNFEQAIDAAEKVAQLLLRCPNVRLIVTSQVSLRVRGETTFPLAPLKPPREGTVEDVSRSDAATLFVRHASAIDPSFEITSENSPHIARICRLLDGLPLALELAAARTRLFTVKDLSRRLDDSFKLLSGGGRDAPERHRTLDATLDWSHELLTEPARACFRDFAVFSGGATVEAVEAVIEVDGDPLETLSDLVEHSLIKRGQDGRFSMLETIRRYALQQLEAHPDRDRIRDRHARYYLALAAKDPEHSDTSFDAEFDNCRSALDWWISRADGSGNAALELATALGRYWYKRGHAVEGIAWFERALSAAVTPDPELHATALHRFGILVEATRDLARARGLFQEALERFRAAGSKRGEAACLNSLGVLMRSSGDPEGAEALFRQAFELRTELGDDAGLSTATSNLGIAAVDLGNIDRAQQLFETALEVDRKLGDTWGITIDLNNLAIVHFEKGDHEQALDLAHRALQGFVDNGDLDGVAEAMEIAAAIAGATGDPVRAARLAGAAGAVREGAGLPLSAPDQDRFKRWMAGPRAELGAGSFESSSREGAAMTVEQATGYALRR